MITLRNLSKKVLVSKKDGVEEKMALNGINLQFGDSGLVVISGSTGSGKSCLARMLARRDNYTEGSMMVDGADLDQLGTRESENYRAYYTGALLGNDELLDDLTIEENIALGLSFGRIKPKKDVMEMLYDTLGLKECLKIFARDCNPSQRYLAGVARILVQSPKVVILDEPEEELEDDKALGMWRLLKNLSETHLVIVVSNAVPYINKFSDRVITLSYGKVVSDIGKDVVDDKHIAEKEIIKKSLFLKKHRFTTQSTMLTLKNFLAHSFGKVIKGVTVLVVAAMLLMLCSTVCTFDWANTVAMTSSRKGDSYVEFYKGASINQRDRLSYGGSGSVIAELQDEGLAFFCAKHELNWDTNINDDNINIKYMITNSEDLTAGDTNRFGQKILSGTYTGNAMVANDEAAGINIVISDYLAEKIIDSGIEYGFAAGQNIDGGWRNQKLYDKLTDPNNQNAINLKLNGANYHIIGIYETDFDKYVDNDWSIKSDLADIWQYNLDNVYTVIQVNTNFYNINAKQSTEMQIDANQVSTRANGNALNGKIFGEEDKLTIINSQSNMFANYYQSKLSQNIFNSTTGVDGTLINHSNIAVSADVYQAILANNGITKTIDEIINDENPINPSGSSNLYNVVAIKTSTYSNNYTIGAVIKDADITKTIIVQGGSVSNTTAYEFQQLYMGQMICTNGVVMPVSAFKTSEISGTIRQMQALGYSVTTVAYNKVMSVNQLIGNLRIIFIIISVAILAAMCYAIYVLGRKLYQDNAKSVAKCKCIGSTNANIYLSMALLNILTFVASALIGMGLGWVVTIIINAIISGSSAYSITILSINGFVILGVLVVGLSVPYLTTSYANDIFDGMTPVDIYEYKIAGKKNTERAEAETAAENVTEEAKPKHPKNAKSKDAEAAEDAATEDITKVKLTKVKTNTTQNTKGDKTTNSKSK